MDADSRFTFAILLVQTATSLTFGGLLLRFRREHDQPHIAAWAYGWLALSAYFAATAIGGFALRSTPGIGALRLGLTISGQVAALWHVTWFTEGVARRLNGGTVFTRHRTGILAGVAAVAVGLALAYTWDPGAGLMRFAVRLGGRAFFTGIALSAVGIWLLRRRPTGALGHALVGTGTLVYGLDQLLYFGLVARMLQVQTLPDFIIWLGIVDLLAAMAAGIGMIIWLLEDERERRHDSVRSLTTSELRHRRIVEGTGVALWEEDLTDLVTALESVPASTEEECRAWLTTHPEFVRDAVAKIRVLGVNDATLRLYGARSKDELLAALGDLFLPESFGVFVEELVTFWGGGTSFDTEVASRTLRDDRRILFYSIRVPFPEEGFRYVLVSVVDVTPLKAAEAALRESEERYRTLFDNAPIGIGVSDATGGLLAVNDTLLSLGGYTRDEGLPPVSDLYYDSDVRDGLIVEVRTLGTVRQREVRFRHKDGSPWAANLSLARVTIDSRPCVLAIVEDISQRKRLEEALRQAQKMEAMGQLTGGIAHDFNNFLTAIQVNAELAAELVEEDPREAREALAAVRRTAERSAALVRNLLAFSRREGLRLAPLAVRTVLQETTAMLRRVLPETITVTLDVPEELEDVRVAGDQSAIEQMLVNLATNARDAMPHGGSLHLAVEERVLRAPTSVVGGELDVGTWLAVAVTDTGAGMTDAMAERAFEPFFTTKAQGAGSGLGLAMVYGLARQHQGGVSLETAPNEGTTFTLFFRRTADAHAPPPAATAAAALGKGETVLVVEDDLAIREATRRLLDRSGYRVLVAADGAEGLSVLAASNGSIQLVVADVVMPTMGGPALLQAARAQGMSVPFVFMSGYTERTAHPALDPNVPLLAKPWRTSDLLAVVHQALA